jgi:hypothetical protein
MSTPQTKNDVQGQNQGQATGTGGRKQSPLQVGIERLRDPNILAECKNRIDVLTNTVKENSTLAFDLLYVDVPWKHVSVDYLNNLPVSDLLVKDQLSGLLLWSDTNTLSDSIELMTKWGFKYHSVLHVVTYENKLPTPISDNVSEGSGSGNGSVNGNGNGNGSVNGNGNGNGSANTVNGNGTANGSSSNTEGGNGVKVSKKLLAPHGWQTGGIVTCKTRMLLFGYAGETNPPDTSLNRIFKDFSFIRKRLSQVSNFVYPENNPDCQNTGLSSKKKNIENWVVYPNYDVYTPNHLRGVFETFIKPNVKVLSMFTNGLSKSWFSWGPNVPGYLNGPLKPDSGFSLLCALQKYFSCMKTATVNKYLTLINLYVIQLAKQEGLNVIASTSNSTSNGASASTTADTSNPPEPCVGALVLQRFGDFLSDLQRKAESGGGVRDGPLSNISLVQLKDLSIFSDLNCVQKTQLLVQVAQVIKHTLRKISEAASHRKRVVKRKREEGVDESGEGKPAKSATPRKYGIAAPVDISPDLASFMEVPTGEKVARTAVVKFINKYIVENALQNPERKSEILVQKDDKLLKLLNPDPNFGTVTYFNLCKLLGPHFIRTPKTTEMAVTA